MSGEYAQLLRRRALSMLRLAEQLLEQGEADLAALNAEYAAQLYLKSLLYRVSGEEWCGHGVRTLLGALAMLLRENGFHEEAEAVEDHVRRNRRLLAELGEARTRAVYGALEYAVDQARKLVKAAEQLGSSTPRRAAPPSAPSVQPCGGAAWRSRRATLRLAAPPRGSPRRT